MTHAALSPIAVDAMGGDRGAAVVVEGCIDAVKSDGERVVVVGRAAELQAALDGLLPSWRRDHGDALRVVLDLNPGAVPGEEDVP